MAFSTNPRILARAGKGIPDIIDTMKEVNSAAFKAGELVYAAASGTTGAITVCASDATLILGIAQKDATNVSSGNIVIPVEVIRPGDRLAIQCYDTSDAAVKLASTFYPGKAYGLVVASNVHYVDFDEITADAFIFIEPLDTVNYPYWGIFEPKVTVCQVGYGV